MHPKLLQGIAVASLLLICFLARASDDLVKLQFSNVSLEDLLMYYSRCTNRQVWIELGVHATVRVVTDLAIPRDEAMLLIRKTLRDQYHIEVRDTETTAETFVSWSKHSRYPDIPSPTPQHGARRIRIQ